MTKHYVQLCYEKLDFIIYDTNGPFPLREVYNRARKGFTCTKSKKPCFVSHMGTECMQLCQLDDMPVSICIQVCMHVFTLATVRNDDEQSKPGVGSHQQKVVWN
jgi:hypothetical protein